jgi:hypothetical protein
MTGRKPVGVLLFALLPTLMIFGGSGTTAAPITTAPAIRTVAATTVPAVCATPARRGFTPLRATVAHVGRNITVLAMGRGPGHVPLPPPLTTSGKRSFAWDRDGPKPGAARGNVRFNAHTYPDGSALGNRLLSRLRVGARIILYGNGVALCYKVNRKVVTTPRHLGGYYSTTGTPKLAIVVCSGKRLGPGNWTRRTIWYARPSVS